jgi:CheY-like chemotaxis protein
MTKFNKVLLIEDDPITIMVCDRVLQMNKFGKTIITKTNGQEAIDYLHHLINCHDELPEVIFLDINMPVMNGWDFLNELQLLQEKLTLNPLVYMLSSTVDPEDTKRSKMYNNVVGFISKPLTKNHLDNINRI